LQPDPSAFHMNLSKVLISWYLENKRDLPWRNTGDPYIIWISEIILQQTRVIQGTDYFYRFIEAFPDIRSLAEAKEEEVLKLWQGLGYYSRARNLHQSAGQIMKVWDGKFPSAHEDILKLKGIGEYTSAAIASFAFGKAYPVLDGNVFRFLARYFGIKLAINTTEGKKVFYETVSGIMDKKNPGLFNQSIMEFGALQCKPSSPDCSTCPLSQSCFALKNKAIQTLPVKLKAKVPKIRHFNYLLIEHGSGIYLKQRTENDIWKNLYDLPLIETPSAIDLNKLLQHPEWLELFGNSKPSVNRAFISLEHQLTHRLIKAVFWKIKLKGKKSLSLVKVGRDEIQSYPVSRLLEKYLEKNFF
jgi:A/G-specific adenine glycosylase